MVLRHGRGSHVRVSVTDASRSLADCGLPMRRSCDLHREHGVAQFHRKSSRVSCLMVQKRRGREVVNEGTMRTAINGLVLRACGASGMESVQGTLET